jgi:tetratricopeptide (TPR) repeat protein
MRIAGLLAFALFLGSGNNGRCAGALLTPKRCGSTIAAWRRWASSLPNAPRPRFAEALKKDPKLAQAAINEGIALLTMQKLDEAKKALQQAITLDPDSAQAWYNLGLAQHAGNESELALKSFQQAVKLDPRDADSYYFEGVCYQDLKDSDKAIAIFKKTLEIDPLHASAEFAIARAYQRSGDIAAAKDHFKRFQHLTSTKIGAPIGLSYGEQGHYSTVTTVEVPETGRKAMIPVKLVAQSPVSQVSKSRPGNTLAMDHNRRRTA